MSTPTSNAPSNAPSGFGSAPPLEPSIAYGQFLTDNLRSAKTSKKNPSSASAASSKPQKGKKKAAKAVAAKAVADKAVAGKPAEEDKVSGKRPSKVRGRAKERF